MYIQFSRTLRYLKGSYFVLFLNLVSVWFWHKRSTKLQISKSTLKGDISCFFKYLFKNYNERLVWTTKFFSCICDITKIIPPTEIRLVGGWGRMLG